MFVVGTRKTRGFIEDCAANETVLDRLWHKTLKVYLAILTRLR